jgi:hypothetical protein
MSRKKDPSDQPFRDSSAKLDNTVCNDDEDQELLALKRLIYRMPDREAPAGLTESILSSLEPKTVPGWVRIYRWALSSRCHDSRSGTGHCFTVRPVGKRPRFHGS